MTGIRLSRIFWIGAAGILIFAALIALVAIVGGDFSDTDAQILVTLAALLYCGGAALAGLTLAERGPARALGRLVAMAGPLCFAILVWAIWNFVDEGGSDARVKLAWSAVLALLAAMIATTSLLLARRPALVTVAGASGILAALAASLSVAGVWSGSSSDALVKTLAALWILAALCYFLVPILQRFTAAEGVPTDVRVLATLGDVELVATRAGRGLEVRLEPGERLALRQRG